MKKLQYINLWMIKLLPLLSNAEFSDKSYRKLCLEFNILIDPSSFLPELLSIGGGIYEMSECPWYCRRSLNLIVFFFENWFIYKFCRIQHQSILTIRIPYNLNFMFSFKRSSFQLYINSSNKLKSVRLRDKVPPISAVLSSL